MSLPGLEGAGNPAAAFLTESALPPRRRTLVLFDCAHGGPGVPGPLPSVGERVGFEVAPLASPATADALREADLLAVCSPTRPFTDDEKRAIVDRVRRGMALLLVLDEECRQRLAGTGVNALIEPFGVQLTADTEYLHNCGALAKAGVIHAADREVPYSGGRAVEGGIPFAWRLDAEGRHAEPFGSYAEVPGGGRVVVLAEAMAAIFLGTPHGIRLTGVPRDPSRITY